MISTALAPPTPAPSPSPQPPPPPPPSPPPSLPLADAEEENRVSHLRRQVNHLDPASRLRLLSLLLADTPSLALAPLLPLIQPRLQRDFLASLPTELADHVLSFIDDPQTLLRAATVSKRWRRLVLDDHTWKRLCLANGFHLPSHPPVFSLDELASALPTEPLSAPRPRGPPTPPPPPRRRRQPLTTTQVVSRAPPLGVGGGTGEEAPRMSRRTRGTEPDRRNTTTVNFAASECGPSPPPPPFSYRAHYRHAFETFQNWHRGPGRLLSTQMSADAGVVTSLAFDGDWIVVGMETSQVHVFEGDGGAYVRTLDGHETGVWCLGLVSKGGGPRPRRRGASEGAAPPPGGADPGADVGTSGEGTYHEQQQRSGPDLAQQPFEAAPRGGGPTLAPRPSSSSSSRPCTPAATVPSRLDPTFYPSLAASTATSTDRRRRRTTDASRRHLHHPGEEEEDDESMMMDDDDDGAGRDSRTSGGMGLGAGGPTSDSVLQGSACATARGWGQDGAVLVSGGCDRTVRVWDVETGYCIHVLTGHTSTVRCLRVLDARPLAVSGSRDGTVRVWDIDRGRAVHVLNGHTSSVRAIDVWDNLAVSGSYDATCRLWNVDTGECLHVFRGHLSKIYSVAFDGIRVVTGSLDSTVRVWSPKDGTMIALLQGHSILVGQLQLDPRTHSLVTGGSDGRVLVFSLESYRLVHALDAHSTSVTCLQVDSKFIVTGGNDGRVKLWDFRTGAYIRDLCDPSVGIWRVVIRDDKMVTLARREELVPTLEDPHRRVEKTMLDVRTFRPLPPPPPPAVPPSVIVPGSAWDGHSYYA
ncbi:hypothetical protein JCM3774_005192 [Rhodotorula dairenensis]